MSNYDGPIGKATIYTQTLGDFHGEIIGSTEKVVTVRWQKTELAFGQYVKRTVDTHLAWPEIRSIEQTVHDDQR